MKRASLFLPMGILLLCLSGCGIIFEAGTPSGIQALAQSSSSILVSWDAVFFATSYKIYRAISYDGPFIQAGTSDTVTYTDTGLSSNTTYYYKVSALIDSREGDLSSSSGYAATQAVSYVPTNLQIQETTANSIRISWNSVDDATQYRIYRAVGATSTYSSVGTSTITSYTSTGLSQNMTYYFKVSAYVKGSEQTQSAYISGTTGASGPPAVPGGLRAVRTADDTVRVSWSAVSGAVNYIVYQSTSFGGTYQYYGSVTDTFCSVYVAPGVSYYFKVSAVNAIGEGSQSASVAVSTPGSISNITYSVQSGGSWTLLGDGRRRSPAVAHSGTAKIRVNFTSTGSNTPLTIRLAVSSESGYDFAFVGNLDSSSATKTSNFDRISGVTSKDITIMVPSAGSHYAEVGYGKDSSIVSGSDCAWFEVVQ
ncbi:hypothetical protein FACS189493_4850 [Spirochaetia bacterium]|nr:hypothetical protein FACS189493_4850 [Spirochaetia bacterium]